MTQIYRYPRRDCLLDAGKALGGIGGCIALVLLLDLAVWFEVAAYGLLVAFLVFGWLTLARTRTKIRLDPEGVTSLPAGTRIDWAALQEVSLKYFSTRRDRESGWVRLDLRTDRARISVESNLEGFPEIVRDAAQAVRRNGLDLSPTTASNFAALGHELDVSTPTEN